MYNISFLFSLLFVYLTFLRLLQICWLKHFSAFPLVTLWKPILFVVVCHHIFLLLAVSEDALKLSKNDAGNDYYLLRVDEFFHWGYLRAHEAGTKNYAEVVFTHFCVLCEGKDSIFQEVEEQEYGHPVDLRKFFDVLADNLNEVFASLFLHEELEHRIGNDWSSKEGNKSFDGVYICLKAYSRWHEDCRLMRWSCNSFCWALKWSRFIRLLTHFCGRGLLVWGRIRCCWRSRSAFRG